jgi:Flp pilus assembly CpaE family ATPase
MRDAIRLKSLVETLAPQAKLLMVAGIAKDGTGGRLSRAAFERGLARALDHVIPLDAKAAAAATDSGKPLAVLARQSPTVKAFRKLAEDMAAPDGRRKPVAFWRRWMS